MRQTATEICGANRESRPTIFSTALVSLENVTLKLEEFASKVEGAPLSTKPGEEGIKAPTPTIREIMEQYPERLRITRDRLENVCESLEKILF